MCIHTSLDSANFIEVLFTKLFPQSSIKKSGPFICANLGLPGMRKDHMHIIVEISRFQNFPGQVLIIMHSTLIETGS